jgi:hypothetical protein
MAYMLKIQFMDGTEEDVMMDRGVHSLSPDNVRPHALVYGDQFGNVFNIPFSSIKRFSFNPQEYSLTQAALQAQSAQMVVPPTPTQPPQS